MAAADLTKSKQVVLKYHHNDVNRFLAAGWTLIETAPGKDEQGYPLTAFTLAWLGDGAPVEPLH